MFMQIINEQLQVNENEKQCNSQLHETENKKAIFKQLTCFRFKQLMFVFDKTSFALPFFMAVYEEQWGGDWGRNEGWHRRRNSPGAVPLWGAKSLRVRRKVPTLSQLLSSVQYICSQKSQVRAWGRQTCFLPRAPSDLVTPLVVIA